MQAEAVREERNVSTIVCLFPERNVSDDLCRLTACLSYHRPRVAPSLLGVTHEKTREGLSKGPVVELPMPTESSAELTEASVRAPQLSSLATETIHWSPAP